MATTQNAVVVSIKVLTDEAKKGIGQLGVESAKSKEELKKLKKDLQDAFAKGNEKAIESIAKKIAEKESALKTLNKQMSQYQSTATKQQELNTANKGSYEALLREYELGVVALKNLEGGIKKNKDGTFTLSEEYRKQAEVLKKQKDAIDSFNKGIGDNRSLVGTYAEAIREATKDSVLFQGGLGTLVKGFDTAKQGTELFKNGINGVGTALKANPLGIFLTALDFLKSLFGENNIVIKVFQQYLAGLGAIFDGIVGTIKSVGSLLGNLFTGDVEGAKESAKAVGNYASSLGDFAQRGKEVEEGKQQLTKREKEYELQLKNSEAQVNNLVQQAKDVNLTTEERAKLLKEAGQIELDTAREGEQLASDRLEQLKKEEQLLIDTGKNAKEVTAKRKEAETEYLNAKTNTAQKVVAVEQRTKDLIIAINTDILNKKKGLLDSEVALLESQGKNATAKKREAVETQYKIDVESAKGNLDLLKTAENNRQTALNNINNANRDKYKEVAEQRKADAIAQQEELDNALVNLIEAGGNRQIAQIVLEGKRRLDAIKSTGDERVFVEEAIALDIANKLAEVNQQVAEEELQKKNETIQKNADAVRSERERLANEEENQIKLQLSRGEITEQEANARRLENQRVYAEQELQLVAQTQIGKQVALETSIQQQKDTLQKQYDEGKISLFAFNQETAEIEKQAETDRLTLKTETDAQILTAETNLQNALTEVQVNANTQRLEDEKNTAEARKQIQEQVINATQQGLSALAGLLSKDEESRKKNAKVLKAIAIAEVGINAYQEISGYWTGAGKDASKTGVYGGIGATILAAVLTASAIARSISAISKITSTGNFARGGYTGEGFPMIDSSGFRVAGVVHEGEYVVPQWMLKNSQIAPIVGSLERFRQNRVGFADGGFTSAFKVAQGIPKMNEESIANAFDGAIKKVQIIASADEITSTQAIQTSIIDGATI
jgi:hypothetical protein